MGIYIYIYTKVLARRRFTRKKSEEPGGLRNLRNLRNLRDLRHLGESLATKHTPASALEKAGRACPVPPVRSKSLFEPASVPPVRSKRLFEPASVPPVRSKRLFESAVQDHYSKVLHSANTVLCASLLCSPCSVHVYARVHASIYIYIYIISKQKCSFVPPGG